MPPDLAWPCRKQGAPEPLPEGRGARQQDPPLHLPGMPRAHPPLVQGHGALPNSQDNDVIGTLLSTADGFPDGRKLWGGGHSPPRPLPEHQAQPRGMQMSTIDFFSGCSSQLLW